MERTDIKAEVDHRTGRFHVVAVVSRHFCWSTHSWTLQGVSGSSLVVWICSDLLRVRASLRYPSLFPSSPTPPPPPPVVTFACSLSPLNPPHLILSPTPNLPLLPPSPPSPPLHLLSQGPCGTLRGWWGWGWWWCRWWWNSHSVSSFPVLEPEARLTPCPPIPLSSWRKKDEDENGEEDEADGFLSLPQFHPRISLQHPPPSRHIRHLCLSVFASILCQV